MSLFSCIWVENFWVWVLSWVVSLLDDWELELRSLGHIFGFGLDDSRFLATMHHTGLFCGRLKDSRDIWQFEQTTWNASSNWNADPWILQTYVAVKRKKEPLQSQTQRCNVGTEAEMHHLTFDVCVWCLNFTCILSSNADTVHLNRSRCRLASDLYTWIKKCWTRTRRCMTFGQVGLCKWSAFC